MKETIEHISMNERGSRPIDLLGNTYPQEQGKDTRKSSDDYLTPELLDIATIEWGLGRHVTIPRQFLLGTQSYGEYEEEKRKQVDKGIANGGEEFMQQNPIYAVAIHEQGKDQGVTCNNTYLAIIDGHHRLRYSGGKGINDIPTIVLSVDEYTVLRNIEKPEEQIDSETMRKTLLDEVGETYESFSSRMNEKGKIVREPLPIPGIGSIDELAYRFQTDDERAG